jgi:hypothetical protein
MLLDARKNPKEKDVPSPDPPLGLECPRVGVNRRISAGFGMGLFTASAVNIFVRGRHNRADKLVFPQIFMRGVYA